MYTSFMQMEQEILKCGGKKIIALAGAQDEDVLEAVIQAKRRGIT